MATHDNNSVYTDHCFSPESFDLYLEFLKQELECALKVKKLMEEHKNLEERLLNKNCGHSHIYVENCSPCQVKQFLYQTYSAKLSEERKLQTLLKLRETIMRL